MIRVNHRCKVSKYGTARPPSPIVMKELTDGNFMVLCPRCRERWLANNQTLASKEST